MKISNSLTLIPLARSIAASIADCPQGAIGYEQKITLTALTCNFFCTANDHAVILNNGEALNKQAARIVLHRGATTGKNFISYRCDEEGEITIWSEVSLPSEVFDEYISRTRHHERFAIVIQYFLESSKKREYDPSTGHLISHWDFNKEESLEIQSVQVRFAAELSSDQIQDLYCRTLQSSYEPSVNVISEKGRLWTLIKSLTTQHAFNNGWDIETFKSRLDESYQWLETLQCALNPMCHLDKFGERSLLDETSWASTWLKEGVDLPADRQLEVIWRWRSPKKVLVYGQESGDYWPINHENIAIVAHYYLQYPWLQCRQADYYLLCGFLYSEYLALIDSEKQKLPGWIALSVIGHGNKSLANEKHWLSIIFGFARWSFKVGALGGLTFTLAHNFNWPIAALAGILTYKIHSITNAIDKSQEQERTMKIGSLFDRMERDYQLLWDTNCLSPAYFKECLLESTRAGVVWPKPVFAILERAINRDPAVWK